MKPVDDFKELVSYSKDDDSFEKGNHQPLTPLYLHKSRIRAIFSYIVHLAACAMLQQRVVQFVMDSFGSQAYSKALDCLKTFRLETIKVRIMLPTITYSRTAS